MAVALIEAVAQIRQALAGTELVVVDCDSVQSFEQQAARLGDALDVLVIGSSVDDPVQWASRAYRVDAALSVVILGDGPPQCDRLRSALRFAPLIGGDVVCCDVQQGRALGIVEEAAARARARRKHRRALRALEIPPVSRSAPPPRPLERYAAHLVELAPIGIVVTDGDRRVVSVNAEAARMLGGSEREMLGLVVGTGQLGADPAKMRELLASATTQPGPPMVIERRSERGTAKLEVRAVAIQGDAVTGYLLVFQDITERLALEAQKDEALARAEAASRLKDEFLATVSHELRTPLSAVLGWSRMLRTQLPPNGQERALETIERNALLQSQLVEDLLDITRITTGKLRLEVEQVELIPTIEAAIETVRPSMEAKQIRFTQTFDTRPAPISGDRERLQQVIWNLLSNAVKFTPKGGHVHMVFTRVDSHVELIISDNGQGMAPEFLSEAFQSFRQADGSSTRRHGGLGLGLAITKHLVELHGGTIHAASEGPGRGSCFTVKLPLAPVRVTPPPKAPRGVPYDPPIKLEAPPELLQLRVLVVDDEPDSGELVGEVLVTAGAVVKLALNVEQALAELESFQPDVIVSDIGMPGEDGYAFMKKLRARPRDMGGVTPAAAVTAYARAEDRRRALEAGFQMHLAKPAEPSELLAVVANLARMSALLR